MNPESMSDRYEAELGKAYSIIQERREHIQELLARTIESEAQNHELNQRLSAIKAEFAMAEEEIERLKAENVKLKKLLMACAIGLKVHHLLLESADTSTFSSNGCTDVKCKTCDLLRRIARELGSGGTPKMTSGPV